MSNELVQRIADAVEVALGDYGHSVAYKNGAVRDAALSAPGRVAELEAAIAAYLSAVDESEPVGASDQTRYVLHKKVVNARIAMRKALAADKGKNYGRN